MTNRIRQEVAPGIEFAVESTGFAGSGTIIIPAECVELLPVNTMHNALIQMMPLAKLVNTELFADYIIEQSRSNGYINCKDDDEFQLFEHEGQTPDIDKAIAIIRAIRQRNANRITSKAKRSEIASNYNNIFMNIGKRDGFCCAHCCTSRDLEIDHIVALINGGTNDMDNLQLLCKVCNSQKSDK